MFESYQVAVKISLVNHVSAGLALLTTQFASTDAAAAKLQRRMDSIKTMAKGGALLVGGAGAIAAPFIFAIDKAAELQKQMIAIQLATRGTTGEMDKMRGAIEGIASQTIFSNIDVAKMGKQIATGTGLSAGGVTSLLPVFGKFADVQTLMKGTSFEQSTTTLIRAAHLAGHYDAPGLSKYADLLTKASFIVPGGLGEVANALQYSQGVAKTALGVDDENSVLAVSLLNRLGLKGSRGGTNLIAAMTRTIPGIFGSGLLKGKSNEALEAMGMVDGGGHSKVFNGGKFDMFSWMGLMGEYVQREFATHPEAIARQDIMKNFQHAFGVQGSRVATLLSSPNAIEQFKKIGEQFQAGGGVAGIQQRFADQSVAQQWMNAKTNFISAMTELGTTLLPMASRALKLLNRDLGGVVQWIQSHQEATKKLAQAFLVLAGAMAIGGTVMMLTSTFRGLLLALQLGAASTIAPLSKLIVSLGGLTNGFGALALALAGRTLGLGIVAAVGVGLGAALDKMFPNNPLARFGHWIGNTAFDLTHDDFDPNMVKPRASSGSQFVAPSFGRFPAINPAPVMLDGHQIASVVFEHGSKDANGPQKSTSLFDPTQAIFQAGGGLAY